MQWNPKHSPPVDQTAVEERVARLSSRSLKNTAKVQALRLALSMIDLTTLEGMDTSGKIQALCEKAMHPDPSLADLPSVAAVCVYPIHVRQAKTCLHESGVRVASVATAFPSGNSTLALKLQEVQFALEEGADEVDMVISRGEFLKGNFNAVYDEIAAVKALCGKHRLKVILETGELSTLGNVRKASDLAMAAGADFIKTSTGKLGKAANPVVSLVMLEAIADFYRLHGKRVGMKPAGGISSAKSALAYLVLVYETLGEAWLTPELFRFGASSLANDILLQLGKEERGVYYNKTYIPAD
ncbi:MAG TPA: deoxyribose-phosphate aldolase [Bacteroidia bacterium]|nr:deoxyribose-phosphate aldolase [Bacteroidia bacterium]